MKSQRNTESSICKVRLDRVKLTAVGSGPEPPDIKGYRVVADFRPHRQGKVATYGRVRKFRSLTDSSQILIQYQPQLPWLQPWHVTVIGDDRTGIMREQLDEILVSCLRHRISLFEIAFDFSSASGVDRAFVRQYAQFGKSRRCLTRGGDGQLRFGSRRSTKLVRCYWKPRLNCYRVELELHSALLRKYSVSGVESVAILYKHLLPLHFRFAKISWKALHRHLRRKLGAQGRVLLDEAFDRAQLSLRRVLRFLSRSAISNPHRFVRPLRINREVRSAWQEWVKRFSRIEDHEIVGTLSST